MPSLSLVGEAYKLPAFSASSQSCINLYAEKIDAEAGSALLTHTAGLKRAYQLGSSPIRHLHTLSNGVTLVFCGDVLHKIVNHVVSTVGYVADNGDVGVSDNGLMAVMVVGSNAYRLDLSTYILAGVSLPFTPAPFVCYLDSRFILTERGTQKYWWSDLLSTTFDPLSFASAEANPDESIGIIVNQREMWVIGQYSAEVNYSTGDQDAPFSRMQGSHIAVGCAAPRTIARFGTSVMYLTQTEGGYGQIVMIQGYQPTRISTHAIEYEIANYADIGDAFAFSYQQNGHIFYFITFPSADKTWVYDSLTALWHERAYLKSNGVLGRHLASSHAMHNNKHLVGDYRNGNIYVLDTNTYTDDGKEIVRERTMPKFDSKNERQMFKSFELLIENALGQYAGGTIAGLPNEGIEPEIELSWSDDRGRSWRSPILASMGRWGETRRRVIWRRLGSGRNRVWRIRTTASVPIFITEAILN